MKYCGIYQIKNEKTGKVYVGQSNDIHRRWNEHKTRAFDKNNNCYHKPLYRSIRKYGLETFKFSILEQCLETELNKKEAYWIKKLNCVTPNGYNVSTQILNPVPKIEKCKQCGAIISKTTKNQLCRDCYNQSTRKCEWPTKDELYKLLLKYSFCEVGRMFEVNDNAVRKWCRKYNIPSHAKDYKLLKQK